VISADGFNQVSTQLDQIDQRARDYAAHSRAPNTLKAYRQDWAHFTTWCEAHGLQSLPAESETIIRYLTGQAAGGAVKVSTITRRLSSISRAHQLAGYNPISTRIEPLRSVWLGIRRDLGTAQKGKSPAVTEDIRAMVAALPPKLIGVRDRALLLIGFAGAFRRSELVSLDVGDVEILREGLRVTLRRSKTDQEGAGREVAIPYGSNPDTCPVRALQAWLEASALADSPLWVSIDKGGRLGGRLSDKAVALIVKKRAQAAGLDPQLYAGHSLRSGLATAAAAAGASERSIMEQTGHRSIQTVRRYIRRGNQFRDNAAGMVGL
jgi:site-specific recombinase XerD